MQVTCPNCGARYAVDPLAIGPTGRTVQCARCSHRWREEPPALAAAPPPLPPRPVPDFVIRPPTYNSGLPALATPPRKTYWGQWLSIAGLAVVVLVIAAYALRGEILATLPPEWREVLHVDAMRALFRQ
jgi:predicted Zn finger-like uncharacterized protein